MTITTAREKFVDIEGFEGKYQISNFGRVKSLRGIKKPFLKPRKIGKGYLSVDLRQSFINEKGEEEFRHKEHYVHRLVAKYFVKNPDPTIYVEVKHRDGDKENNHKTNLVWVTTSERIDAMVEKSSQDADGSGHIRLTKKDVEEIRSGGYKEVDAHTTAEIFNVTKGYVNMIKRGERREVKPVRKF